MFEINDLLCSIEAEHPIRQKVRNFIRLNEPPKISPETNLEEFVTEGKRWQKKLFEAKLLGNFVPEEYGGCGTSYLAEAISLETLGL
ncbi:MAG: acyl-CoA dehydrogenase family protein, partial [Deltaproteobacteria bacterium]|nr:acyl-CoA dehydrogenase family protein [Deltaproteobacteria bacterium]